MLTKLISFATGRAMPYIILTALAAGLAGGYKAKSLLVDIEDAKQLEDALKQLEVANKRNGSIAKLYFEETQKRRGKVREKIREVIKYVDVNNCTLTDNGLSKLSCQLSPATCAAEPTQ